MNIINKTNTNIFIILLLILTIISCSKEDLVVVSYGGGEYQQSHINAFTEPYSKKYNLKIESVVWGAEYNRLYDMVNSKRVNWDVVEVTAAQYSRGKKDSLFAKITEEFDDSLFIPLDNSSSPEVFGVPNVYWSTVLAYSNSYKSTQKPNNWVDFWDLEEFPGPRGMYDDPRGNLEFALIAAGTPIDSLYPIDIEKAFNKLDEIKDNVRLWWTDGTEPVGALMTNQIVMSSAWSGRIFASENARDNISYTWEGAAHELDYWIIPKGSKNVSLASDLIKFMSTPQNMAEQANYTAYGPSNLLAIKYVRDDVKPHLPTMDKNWELSFVIDSNWWSENEKEVINKWIIWKNK